MRENPDVSTKKKKTPTTYQIKIFLLLYYETPSAKTLRPTRTSKVNTVKVYEVCCLSSSVRLHSLGFVVLRDAGASVCPYHQVAANLSRQGSLVMSINSTFVFCIERGSVTASIKETGQNIPVARSGGWGGVICLESSQATVHWGKGGGGAIRTITVKSHILILFNEKYTYLQIVDIFSYGFRKYSTI